MMTIGEPTQLKGLKLGFVEFNKTSNKKNLFKDKKVMKY